jgi:hypothetical protein
LVNTGLALFNTATVLFNTVLALFNTVAVLFNTALALFNTVAVLFNTALALFNTVTVLFNTVLALFNTVAVLFNTALGQSPGDQSPTRTESFIPLNCILETILTDSPQNHLSMDDQIGVHEWRCENRREVVPAASQPIDPFCTRCLRAGGNSNCVRNTPA